MVDVRQPDEIIATAGDIIAFERRIFDWLKIFTYFHFAVCTVTSVADPQVIVEQNEDRFTVGVDTPSEYWSKTRIVEKTIGTLCDKHGWRVNNPDEAATKLNLKILSPDVIVERARGFLREDLERYYNVITENCEHFATKCRYEKDTGDELGEGIGFSLQVSDNCLYPLYCLYKLCSDFVRKFCCSTCKYPNQGALEGSQRPNQNEPV